ncbi:Lichenan-specific phosphotransferase enzyme IIB component [compost metagenome]
MSKYIEKADYVLFAPQIKYALKDISKRYETYNVPMDMITEEDYAFLNFNNILTNIKKKIKVMDI